MNFPAVRAEAYQGGMVQLHVGSHAAVLPLKEIFSAPDTDSAVIRTGGQILAVAAEVHARYIPTVALQCCSQKGVREAVLLRLLLTNPLILLLLLGS